MVKSHYLVLIVFVGLLAVLAGWVLSLIIVARSGMETNKVNGYLRAAQSGGVDQETKLELLQRYYNWISDPRHIDGIWCKDGFAHCKMRYQADFFKKAMDDPGALGKLQPIAVSYWLKSDFGVSWYSGAATGWILVIILLIATVSIYGNISDLKPEYGPARNIPPSPVSVPPPIPHEILLDEAIEGWRYWRVILTSRGPQLTSINDGIIWPPKQKMISRCYNDTPSCSDCPSFECSCGLYAYKIPTPGGYQLKPGICRGKVALWGKIIEHENGYRAQYAYPTFLEATIENVPPDVFYALVKAYGLEEEDDRYWAAFEGNPFHSQN